MPQISHMKISEDKMQTAPWGMESTTVSTHELGILYSSVSE